MIDVETEEVVALSRAARWVPQVRNKQVHSSTMWRWHMNGIKGIRLEVIKIGGTTCTSREALARFFERLTVDKPSPTYRTRRQREREIAAAERELEAEGI